MRKKIYLLTLLTVACIVLIFFARIRSVTIPTATTSSNNDVGVYIPVANEEVDGVHYSNSFPITGPTRFWVGSDKRVTVEDSGAKRNIAVDRDGKVISSTPFPAGETSYVPKQPQQQFDTKHLIATRDRLAASPRYTGFNVEKDLVKYWGTSPRGLQYWQTSEVREDGVGMARAHFFLVLTDAAGREVARAELATPYQHVRVADSGVYVDVENDAAYQMVTMPRGVLVSSVDFAWETRVR